MLLSRLTNIYFDIEIPILFTLLFQCDKLILLIDCSLLIEAVDMVFAYNLKLKFFFFGF